MTRIVIHAGFHKTGTSSVQSLLHVNRDVLSDSLRVCLKPDFEPLTEAARAFSADPGPMGLADMTDAAQRFFATLDPDDPRPVLMSSEDLSGHMPGRLGLERYDAAELIMPQIAEAALMRFGAEADLRFYFSTRAPDPWLRSAWWQNLRATRLTLDFDAYAARFAEAADLDAVLHSVAEAVAPLQVAACPLEESSSQPQGPLTPLLDLVGLPEDRRAALTMLPPANVQPELGLQPVMLALNRSGLKLRQIKEVKRILRGMADRLSKPE